MSNEVTEPEHPYTMTMSLSVLEHLGLNLYSNIPAVVAEVVANAWDADAKKVTIDINTTTRTITVVDDGIGMTTADLNDRFLLVGYRRRDDETAPTPKDRHVMGRKGIGKLSLFAIANTITVESAKDGERAGLVLRAEKIREQIAAKKAGDYHPDPIDSADVTVTQGTRIVLTDLRLKPTSATVEGLRKRLARRFSIIGPDNNFRVEVNGAEVGVTDRDFYPKIEYLWSLGDSGDEYEKLCVNAADKKRLTGDVDTNQGWIVKGWVGTVDEQKSIDEETNIIPVLAWGKLIHEDLLSAVKATGVFSKYLMGEIHADFVDQDTADDIATSDRQSLKEDDERFIALKNYLSEKVLKTVGSTWLAARRKNALDKAIKNPIVKEWYDGLSGDAKDHAKQLFGKIGDMSLENESDRIELYKNCILAFEKLRYRNLLSQLDALESPGQLDVIGKAFAGIDELEAAQYGEIAKGRMSVIKSFKGLVDADEREKVLQLHLFEHIWLIDPSWERAATNVLIEQRVTTEFDKITAKLSEEEKKARWDIKYRTAAGKHIIIEMKRYSVSVSTGQLFDQLGKYRSALLKCLKENFPEEPTAIECIAVLGKPPHNVAPDEVDQALRSINARVKTYDDLINGALRSYAEYLEKHAEVGKLANLIERLEKSAISSDDAAAGDGNTDGNADGKAATP
jgi:hypothetical protein